MLKLCFALLKKKKKKGTVLYSWSRSNLIWICDTALLVTVCRDTNINGYWAYSNEILQWKWFRFRSYSAIKSIYERMIIEHT